MTPSNIQDSTILDIEFNSGAVVEEVSAVVNCSTGISYVEDVPRWQRQIKSISGQMPICTAGPTLEECNKLCSVECVESWTEGLMTVRYQTSSWTNYQVVALPPF